MELPVRHILLRDDRDWRGDLHGLARQADGTLALVRVPAAEKPITAEVPFDPLPSGIATDGCETVYLIDADSRRIVCHQLNCEARYTKVIGNAPSGVAVTEGIVYVADAGSACVWLLSAHTLELRGSIESWFDTPTAVAVDSQRRLYVLDRGLQRILRLTATGALDTAFVPAVGTPKFMALGSELLYVSDSSLDQVRVFNLDGSSAGELEAPVQSTPMRPRALALRDNLLLVADAATGAILVFDAARLECIGEVPEFRAPVAAMAFDACGNLLVKHDGGSEFLRLVAGAGCVTRGWIEAGPFDAGELNDWELAGLASAGDGEVRLATFAAPGPGVAVTWRETPGRSCLLARDAEKADAPHVSRRFLWLRADLRSIGRNSPHLEQLRAQTIGASYLDELPRIYRRDDRETQFLSRWLALFRFHLERRTDDVDTASQEFDPAMVRATRLGRPAEALAFQLPAVTGAASSREILRQVPRLYAQRGTLAGVQAMAQVYSGIRPRIIEAYEARRVWQLGTTSLLGFDTALAAATPEGFIVPRDARTDPAYTGLRGDYFAGTGFNEPVFSRTDADIAFDALSVVEPDPAQGVPAKIYSPFTVRWSGQLRPRYSETYLLRFEHGPGLRLWIDGQLLINSWVPGSPAPSDVRLVLDASRWHSIQIELLSEVPRSRARFSWSSRHQPLELVPPDCLYSVLDEHAVLPPAKLSTFDVGHAVVGESAPLAASEFGESLFGDYAHLFTVLAPAGSCREAAQRAALREVIEAEKPAHTDYHLCFVEPRMRVGFQARLGIDAIIAGGPPPLRLDGTQLDRDAYLADAPAGGARLGTSARLGHDTIG